MNGKFQNKVRVLAKFNTNLALLNTKLSYKNLKVKLESIFE